MHDGDNTLRPGRQSPWGEPKRSTIFEPQSERQRHLFEAMGAVSENDRAWFEANPDRTLRLRWATKDEIEGWAFAVMVCSLALGAVRFRAFVAVPLDVQPERFDERQCCKLARAALFSAKIIRAMKRAQKARRHHSQAQCEVCKRAGGVR